MNTKLTGGLHRLEGLGLKVHFDPGGSFSLLTAGLNVSLTISYGELGTDNYLSVKCRMEGTVGWLELWDAKKEAKSFFNNMPRIADLNANGVSKLIREWILNPYFTEAEFHSGETTITRKEGKLKGKANSTFSFSCKGADFKGSMDIEHDMDVEKLANLTAEIVKVLGECFK